MVSCLPLPYREVFIKLCYQQIPVRLVIVHPVYAVLLNVADYPSVIRKLFAQYYNTTKQLKETFDISAADGNLIHLERARHFEIFYLLINTPVYCVT